MQRRCPECGYPRQERESVPKCWRANLDEDCRRRSEEAWLAQVKPFRGRNTVVRPTDDSDSKS